MVTRLVYRLIASEMYVRAILFLQLEHHRGAGERRKSNTDLLAYVRSVNSLPANDRVMKRGTA